MVEATWYPSPANAWSDVVGPVGRSRPRSAGPGSAPAALSRRPALFRRPAPWLAVSTTIQYRSKASGARGRPPADPPGQHPIHLGAGMVSPGSGLPPDTGRSVGRHRAQRGFLRAGTGVPRVIASTRARSAPVRGRSRVPTLVEPSLGRAGSATRRRWPARSVHRSSTTPG